MVILLTNSQRASIVKKARSGNYYVVLTEYDNKKGQHILIFPTNKGLSKGIPFGRNFYPVRLPKIPRPPVKRGRFYVQSEPSFDRRRGAAYKEGRFFVTNNSIRKVLKIKM